jgi:hypothetical protein
LAENEIKLKAPRINEGLFLTLTQPKTIFIILLIHLSLK